MKEKMNNFNDISLSYLMECSNTKRIRFAGCIYLIKQFEQLPNAGSIILDLSSTKKVFGRQNWGPKFAKKLKNLLLKCNITMIENGEVFKFVAHARDGKAVYLCWDDIDRGVKSMCNKYLRLRLKGKITHENLPGNKYLQEKVKREG